MKCVEENVQMQNYKLYQCAAVRIRYFSDEAKHKTSHSQFTLIVIGYIGTTTNINGSTHLTKCLSDFTHKTTN